ncbi:MAG: p-hydroxybenzoic acid efflux pump subunit AaeA [Thermoanaerobaculia bacterium]|nr:p-hydroxybenzoic acid efflux pump subunit AaeA [Thermoanaerobaculia bacterium]
MKKAALFLSPVLLLVIAVLTLRESAQAGTRPSSVPLVVEPAPEAAKISAEGRVVAYPGYEVEIGADFAGRVARVLVDEQSVVKKGDILAEIDASEEEAALRQALSRVREAEADLRLSEAEVSRAAQLLESKVGTRQSLDKAERDRDAASARRQTAGAEVERLTALLRKAAIRAPFSGTILSRHISAGETVERGTPAFSLADLAKLRIEAEVDEMDTDRVKLGAPARITAEGGGSWSGKVEEIPDAVAGRKLKPQDPSKPLDTRVLLVKVALDSRENLKLGRRVEVEIAAQSSR